VDLSLIIPFYNPGPQVRRTAERAATALSEAGRTFEIIAVSDGSTDGSERSLDGVLPESLRVVVLPANRGKGYAIRTGMQLAIGEWVGFIDADGDIPSEVLVPMMDLASETGAAIVFGSKRHPESDVTVSGVRRISSWGYRHLVKRLFHLAVPDTQTGVKLLRREVVSALLPLLVEERYVLDLEVFVLAQRLGFVSFVEAPIRVEKQYSSTVSVRSVRSIVWDTLKVYWRFRSNGGSRPARVRRSTADSAP
jgi:glycosyltransferase involved in cell wall biosynthesis